MKAVLIKTMLTVAVMLVAANTIDAKNTRTIFNNDTVKDGKIVAREVCAEENGIMKKISRSEMDYNENGQMTVKREFVWNAEENAWKLSRSYEYQFEEGNYRVVLTDAQGNTKILDFKTE